MHYYKKQYKWLIDKKIENGIIKRKITILWKESGNINIAHYAFKWRTGGDKLQVMLCQCLMVGSVVFLYKNVCCFF